MNNMMIVLVPFVGDVSDLVSNMITEVYSVMASSKSAKVIICVNKCGEKLEQLKSQKINGEEIKNMEPIRDRYIKKLNEHFKQSDNPIKKVNKLIL